MESLASYVCRLAEAHSVGVATLCRHVIIPEIGIDDRGKGLRYLASRGHLVNGVGKVARDWLQALSRLTGNEFLQGTNFLPLESLATPRHFLKKTSAWCPFCLEERLAEPEGPFESLAWAVLVVEYCHRHKVRLNEVCPHCSSHVPFFTANRRIGCCSNCHRWLGGKYESLKQRARGDPETLIRMAEIVGDLLAELPNERGEISPASLKEGIRKAVAFSFNGTLSTFAKKVGKRKGAVSAWRSGAVSPSFQEVVNMAFITGIPTIDILTGNVSSEQRASNRTIERFPDSASPRNCYRNRTFLLEKELQAALEREDPESVASISQKVGVPARYAWLYCPDLAREASERRRQLLSNEYKVRESFFREELSKTMKEIREQGIYPSLRKVGEKTARKAKLRRDQSRSSWEGEIEKHSE